MNIMEFCKAYNAATQDRIGHSPSRLTVFEDRSFTFVLKTPPAAVLIRQAAGIAKGAANPRKDKVGKITRINFGRSPRSRCPISTPTTSTRP